MNSNQNVSRNDHNEAQKRYFTDNFKKTMQPASTAYLRRHVEQVIDYAKLRQTDRILDVGCGIGKYTLILAEKGFQVEGLDLTPALIEQFREFDNGRYNIPLYCADILTPPPEIVGQYDKIVSFFTLHHLYDFEGSFAAMKNLLKPGGSIVLLEPNAFNPLYYVQITITPRMTWEGDGGVAKMRKSVIFPAMTACGLENLDVRRFGFFPPFITNGPGGEALESAFERFPLWQANLPFQMFKGVNPGG